MLGRSRWGGKIVWVEMGGVVGLGGLVVAVVAPWRVEGPGGGRCAAWCGVVRGRYRLAITGRWILVG